VSVVDRPSKPIDATLFDATTRPAEDFYQYVNGGWLASNPVPAEYGSWGAFHHVTERNEKLLHELVLEAANNPGATGTPEQMVGDYFAAAMDEAAIAAADLTPVEDWFARIDAAGSVADVKQIASELHRGIADVFHSFGIAPDFEDSDAYLAYLGQGGLGLPEREYYTRDDERSVALRDAYRDHIARQLANLGSTPDAAHAAAERVLAFETRLASASYTAEQQRDVQLTMNRHAVDTLDELMPGFGLTSYVHDLGVTCATVNVDNAGFFVELDLALAQTPIGTLREYLRFHLVRSLASALPPRFETEAFEFYGRTLGGRQEMRTRWKRVLEAAGSDIGELVAQLYVDAAFPEFAKRRCESMVEHLLRAMGEAIRDAEWMTPATKSESLTKLAGFSYKIGYPDEWRDYTGLVIDRGSHVGNRIRCSEFEYDREMRRLGDPVDKAEWAMPAHSVNAYYHPLLNEVVFPAGILQPPFFYADADDAVNYGAIGAVIGHEITHGFDDRGSQFDATGALRDWWTEADRAEFERRAALLVDQFDAYQVAEDLHVNGRLTLGENIADLGGLKIALQALHEAVREAPELDAIDGSTPEQRFFLSWATVWRTNYTNEYARLLVNVDPHSPARFRVNGPLANIPAFAAAFGIAPGSPMTREETLRAHIW